MRLGLAVTVSILLGVTAVLASQGGAGAEPEVKRLRDPAIRFQCELAKRGTFDPLFDLEGSESHDHTFFGNREVDVGSTGETLASGGATSCEPWWATGAWWVPALSDRHSEKPVKRMTAYYRGLGDQSLVTAPPLGLELLGNEETAEVTWGCGGRVNRSTPPRGCEKFVREKIFFPNCRLPGSPLRWDGGAGLRYAPKGNCPDGYDKLPDHWIVIDYANPGGQEGALRVSAGAGDTKPALDHAHGDYIAGEKGVFEGDLVGRCIAGVADDALSPEGCLFSLDKPGPGR